VHPRAAAYPIALGPASLSRWALTLPRVPRLRIPLPCQRGLRRCHVSNGSGPRLLTEMGSGVAECPQILDHASSLGRAPASPRVLWLQTLPLGCGVFWCFLVSHGS
jgi:hypothetical protein